MSQTAIPAPKDPLLEKCRELLKGDPGFAAVVINARHDKMVRA